VIATPFGFETPVVGDKVRGEFQSLGASHLVLADGSTCEVDIERSGCTLAEAKLLLGAPVAARG
jgi:hypothetical protein